jgi:hypothetical protein
METKRAIRGRVPMAAFALSAVALLAIAGVVLACNPPTGQNGSCDADGRHWTLTKDNPYGLVEYSLVTQSSNAADADWHNITITGATYDLVTDPSVNEIWWALQPGAYQGQSNAVEHMTWNADKHPCPTATPVPTDAPTATPVPTDPPTETPVPTDTPFQGEQGETATPVASNTPPPTSTDGNSGSSTTPLLALLICVAFGALGLTAVEAQRRSIRR